MYRTPNILLYHKTGIKSVLIIENQKIRGGEVLDALGLFSLEKERKSNLDDWKLNPHYFLLEISNHVL